MNGPKSWESLTETTNSETSEETNSDASTVFDEVFGVSRAVGFCPELRRFVVFEVVEETLGKKTFDRVSKCATLSRAL